MCPRNLSETSQVKDITPWFSHAHGRALAVSIHAHENTTECFLDRFLSLSFQSTHPAWGECQLHSYFFEAISFRRPICSRWYCKWLQNAWPIADCTRHPIPANIIVAGWPAAPINDATKQNRLQTRMKYDRKRKNCSASDDLGTNGCFFESSVFAVVNWAICLVCGCSTELSSATKQCPQFGHATLVPGVTFSASSWIRHFGQMISIVLSYGCIEFIWMIGRTKLPESPIYNRKKKP